MSVSGPSSLGTLLATRLDAVLGTTLAQHPVLLEGMRGHATTQAASALHPQDSVIRRGAGEVPEAGARARSRAGEAGTMARAGREDARPGGAQQGPPVSARATLSEPARLILALLVSRPPLPSGTREGGPPLWPAGGDPRAAARFAAAGRPAAVPGGPAGPGPGSAGTPNRADNPQGAASASGQGRPAAPPGAAASAGASAASNTGQRPIPSAATGAASTDPGVARADAGRADAGRAPGAGSPGSPTGDAGARTAAPTGTNAAAATAAPGASSPMSQALASTLARTVSGSGVFYESHLARLAFGQERMENLLREPQARLGTPPASGEAEAARAQPRQAAGQTLSQWLGSPAGSTGEPSTPAHAARAEAPAPAPVPGIHPEAAPVVRQQLETLANGQFAWQGEAWPGASMQWEIGEDAQAPGEEQAGAWASRLRLHLPQLGEIEARIRLSGNQVVLRLCAAESTATLRAAGGELRARMLDAGLVVSDLAFAPLEDTSR